MRPEKQSAVKPALVAPGTKVPFILVTALFLFWGIPSNLMSLMSPTIFALGIKGLGPNIKLGSSIIIMSIIGGAVSTPIMELILEATRSMATAMLVPLACYGFITYYAFIVRR